MQLRKSKKIIIYFFLFLTIGTFNNKNLFNSGFIKLNKISIIGLDEKYNYQLLESLNFLKGKNLFFLNKIEISEIISKNSLVDEYSVFKHYPSTLNIKIDKTNFLAKIKKKGKNFLLGSNGKFTKVDSAHQDIPFIFGNFDVESFFILKNAIYKSKFDYNEIKILFFFKSGRWDIETKNGLLIKLPKQDIERSFEIILNFLEQDDKKLIETIDLRQENQVILNAR